VYRRPGLQAFGFLFRKVPSLVPSAPSFLGYFFPFLFRLTRLPNARGIKRLTTYFELPASFQSGLALCQTVFDRVPSFGRPFFDYVPLDLLTFLTPGGQVFPLLNLIGSYPILVKKIFSPLFLGAIFSRVMELVG